MKNIITHKRTYHCKEIEFELIDKKILIYKIQDYLGE